MSTPLRPLGHKLIVQPDAAPTETESGFYIPEAYQDLPAMSGTVIRLGDGPERDKQIRAKTIARCISIVEEMDRDRLIPLSADAVAPTIVSELTRYMRQAESIGHACEVGQRVIFPMEAGHEIVLNEATDDAVVVLSEDAILAVYDAEQETVA